MAGTRQHPVALDDRGGKSSLVDGFVVAGCAAGFAIHESIGAQTDVDYRLAQATEFFAFTRTFCLIALRAFVFGGTGPCAHEDTVARIGGAAIMTLVIVRVAKMPPSGVRSMPSAFLRGL